MPPEKDINKFASVENILHSARLSTAIRNSTFQGRFIIVRAKNNNMTFRLFLLDN